MHNRHLILIMVVLLFIIIGGLGGIVLLLRPTAVLVPPASPPSAARPLIGTWRFTRVEAIDADGHRSVGTPAGNGYPELTFFANGTYAVHQTVGTTRRTVTITAHGTYVVVDSTHVRLEVVESRIGSRLSGSQQTSAFTIVGDTLTLIDVFPDTVNPLHQTTTYIRE